MSYLFFNWLSIEQSKNKGKIAIQEAKRLQLARNTICARVHQLQRIISDNSSLDHEVVIAQSDLQKEELCLLKADEQVKAKERAFGANERSQLDRLLKNKYAEMVMNARVLKIHIWQQLISHKFEWDRVECSLREHVNSKLICLCYLSLCFFTFRLWEKTSNAYWSLCQMTGPKYPGSCSKVQQTSGWNSPCHQGRQETCPAPPPYQLDKSIHVGCRW